MSTVADYHPTVNTDDCKINFMGEDIFNLDGADLLDTLLLTNEYDTIADETLPVLFQQDQLGHSAALSSSSFLNSPFSSDGNTSDTAYASPLSCSSTSEAPANSPRQHQYNELSSDVFLDNNQPVPLTIPDDTLQSLLQPDSSDVKLDLADIEMADNSMKSKAGHSIRTTTINEEERVLLATEGITLPEDLPLTKAEEKHLKRVQRKIKNKISAKESRQRKKEYIDGLEERVERCTRSNRKLQTKVIDLENQNQSLLKQLRRLQQIVSRYNPTVTQAGTCVVVLLLSFSLFCMPRYWLNRQSLHAGVASYSSRTLLRTTTDDFGNVIDPGTGTVISQAGGHFATIPPPWKMQSPIAYNRSKPQNVKSDTNKIKGRHTDL